MVWFSYYKTANRIGSCNAMRCGAVRLCHFTSGFGAVFAMYDLVNTPTCLQGDSPCI